MIIYYRDGSELSPTKILDINEIGAVLLERNINEGKFSNEFLWGRNMPSPFLTHRKKEFKDIELTLLFSNQDEKTFLLNKGMLIRSLVSRVNHKSLAYNKNGCHLEFKDIKDMQYVCYYEGPEEVEKVNNTTFLVKIKLICYMTQGKKILFESSGSKIYDLDNPGNYPSPCKITIRNHSGFSNGTGKVLGFTHNITLGVSSGPVSYEIDSYIKKVNKLANSNNSLTEKDIQFWGYPMLPAGKNNITISGSVDYIGIEFNPIY